MSRDLARALRYGRSWIRGQADVDVVEMEMDRGDLRVPLSLYLPRSRPRPLPGWIVLHGITVPGREHPQLVRFARSLASTRAAVAIPEVPEWRRLQLAPEVTVPTVEATVRTLRRRPELEAERFGLVGFSFGGPQAIAAGADPRIEHELAGVVTFGGYCDLARTLRFQFTGVHEWKGTQWRVRPDPYGRWIVGANFLTAVPGYEDAADVAGALRALASEAGIRRAGAWTAVYDELKGRLRGELPRERRELFDLFAPPSHREPDRGRAEALVERFARAAAGAAPLMDPHPRLAAVRKRVQLLHGRGDRLIPFSESLRMAECLPRAADVRVTVTRLFAHSAQDPFPSLAEGLWEGVIFVRALSQVLGTV